MSGNFLLDWAALGISLFNTILLVWLGLTVLLNAERRTWGVWLAGYGLLIGGVFFISHSAILGQNVYSLSQGLNFWWHAGWGPLIAAPFAWYVLSLWYTGFWDDRQSVLFRRQLPWLVLTVLLALVLVGLLLFANPFPTFTQAAQLDLSDVPSLWGVPLLVLGFPLFIVLCILLALDALLRPGPSWRLMGDLARRRARPWLVGTSGVLLVVSLLVGWVMLWVVLNARQGINFPEAYLALGTALTKLDLLLDGLIAAAVLMLGQALISYEIFTGGNLPRRGFLRQWRGAVLLSASVSAVVSWSLTLQLRTIYILLLALLLMTAFYALFVSHTHAEREQSMRQLRPFVGSQRLYEQFTAPSGAAPFEIDLSTTFAALCRDVLGARQAALVPLGPLAPLAGAPILYPPNAELSLSALGGLLAHFDAPQSPGIPLDARQYAGMAWAVPLWSERGLIGLLLLGNKQDGGFYSLEEIEVARASGERLVDLQASVEIARRLVALQRQRLAESQVLDRRARRVLHDDILPRLHTALLELSASLAASDAAGQEAMQLLSQVHRQIADLLHEIPANPNPEVARLGLLGALREVLANELRDAFDRVTWRVAPDAEREADSLPATSAEVVFYAAREALRNAARYARPASPEPPLNLTLSVDWCDGLQIKIEDDGVGLSAAPGGSRGSGQGLALHSTMMAVVGGSLSLESVPGVYTRVTLTLPVH